MRDNLQLDISVRSPLWEALDFKALIRDCMAQVILAVPEARKLVNFSHVELSILLSDDDEIQQLNRDYRSKDQPTNVLSFPSLDEGEIESYLRGSGAAPEFPISLGDIIFAFQTMAGEAEEQNKSLSNHFCHLYIHGMLHLLGYDHIENGQAEKMEALEKNILAKLSIDDPY